MLRFLQIVFSSCLFNLEPWKRCFHIFTTFMQILGAAWYLLSIGRQNKCWRIQCQKENGSKGMPLCNPRFLECASIRMPERKTWLNATRVLHHCDASNTDITFSYGMFADAMTYGVVSAKFPEKYLYCLWWGLRNLRYSLFVLLILHRRLSSFFHLFLGPFFKYF